MAIISQVELRDEISKATLGSDIQIYPNSEAARQLAEWAIALLESHRNRCYKQGWNDCRQKVIDITDNIEEF